MRFYGSIYRLEKFIKYFSFYFPINLEIDKPYQLKELQSWVKNLFYWCIFINIAIVTMLRSTSFQILVSNSEAYLAMPTRGMV